LTRSLTTPSALAADSLAVRPLPDPVYDSVGLDPRSSYVEMYWLGILGPSTTWLLRRLVAGFERAPDGYQLPLADTARCLGLGDKGGRHSPFMRALTRLVQFDLAQPRGSELHVRRKVPPLNRRQIVRLPASLQASHSIWQERELRPPTAQEVQERARRLALTLVELGEDFEAVERMLHHWRYHPAVAREAVLWAFGQRDQDCGQAGGVGGDAA
jgi:hypothetical protein